VIFDLDGVLVDTEIWWDEVRRDFARAQGRAWTADDRASVMGANSRQWSRTMVDRLDLDVSPEEVERVVVSAMVDRWRTAATPLIPGAREAVERLAGNVALAVASSAHPDVIQAALQRTGLAPFFPIVVSSDDVEHGKPAPDVYLEAARRLGILPEAALVVEDSLNGVLAGRAAGMAVVLIPNASIPPAPGAEAAATVVLASLADLDLAHVAGSIPA
jgi:HAD superfamily hydrolase (TIGR01509 family)